MRLISHITLTKQRAFFKRRRLYFIRFLFALIRVNS